MATAVLALRLVLAGVFLTAGIGKLRDLPGSRRAVADFGVSRASGPRRGPAASARRDRDRGRARPRSVGALGRSRAAILLAAFIAGIARALSRGEQPDCHCFGQIHSAPAGPLTLAPERRPRGCAAVIVAYGSGPAVDAWVNARSTSELVAAGAAICAVAAVAYALRPPRRDREAEARTLHIAQAGSRAAIGLPVGADAPAFALRDLQGETVSLDGAARARQAGAAHVHESWLRPVRLDSCRPSSSGSRASARA